MSDASRRTIVVAAAVVRREGRILLTRRMEGAHLAGLWEFPGGKVEPGEDPEVAVVRECREECAIDLEVIDVIEVAFHSYAEKDVLLLFYACRLAPGSGEVAHIGVAEHAWVLPSELRHHPLPPPDERLVRKLERGASRFHIALATREQVEDILAISNAAAAEGFANFATEPEPLDAWLAAYDATHATHPWLVALDGEHVVGFAKSSPHESRGAYAWCADVSVYIEARERGAGVGHALYAELVPLMREQGYVTLLAGIALPNDASERLHTSFGFQRCGVFPRVGRKDGRWIDVAYFALDLRTNQGEPLPVRSVRDVWR